MPTLTGHVLSRKAVSCSLILRSGWTLDRAEIVKIASEVGAKVALERFDRQTQQAKTSRYERRLRNTRLLLKNYRMFKQHVAGSVFDEAQLDGENAIDVLDLVFENSSRELQIESIKRSAYGPHSPSHRRDAEIL